MPKLLYIANTSVDGYTEDDKVAIARDFLLPRQRERAALTTDEVEVTDEALRKIAADYTREPGMRQFERLLAKALRKATTKLAADPEKLVIDEPELGLDYSRVVHAEQRFAYRRAVFAGDELTCEAVLEKLSSRADGEDERERGSAMASRSSSGSSASSLRSSASVSSAFSSAPSAE